VLPRLGGKKIAAVQARNIHALHVAMKGTPYQANWLLALLSKMFSLAVHWGMRGDNPVKGSSATTRSAASAGCPTRSWPGCSACSRRTPTAAWPTPSASSC
jgi:hypothetical protein